MKAAISPYRLGSCKSVITITSTLQVRISEDVAQSNLIMSCIQIPGGKEVWQSLLFTIHDELIIRALTMDYCQSGRLDVFYCDVIGDCVI